LVVVGLMGVRSAFFGSSEYGILPEILPHEELTGGNGLMQLEKKTDKHRNPRPIEYR
jgi:acyl-[acyl-carrier-protein]-phospholipid O-acyltransferase/long-chain-fatty-acid--[acyl-carrier-protein] ligase